MSKDPRDNSAALGNASTTTDQPLLTHPEPQALSLLDTAEASWPEFGTSERGRRARQARTLKDAARRIAAEHERTLSHLTARQRMGIALAEMTTDDMRAVVGALLTDAKSGDTKSIHALARLLDQSFGRAGEELVADDRPFVDKTFEEMTPQERGQYRAELLARIRAKNDPSDPRTDPHTDSHSSTTTPVQTDSQTMPGKR